ncbi:MAG TPA: DnaB-like helicase N-terminal domain-containing protein, partial [Pseudomonadota bacterium]|nr:DnaB-like helicase N-terminal domain-containing protein [Pseudomonadota bacterium]
MATKRFSSNERPATAQGGVAVHTLPPSAGPEGGPVRRVLPHSVDAEESVIGGLLFSGRAMTLVADIINSDDFYDAKHEAIYAAIVELEQRTKPIDLITVAEQMRQSGTLSKLTAHGSEAYLAELLNKIATVENIAHHARIVREKATARRLILAASTIQERGYSDEIDVDGYIDQAQQAVFEIANRSNRQSYEPVRRVLHTAIKA